MLQESGLWRYAATLAATALPAAATAVALEGWANHVAQVHGSRVSAGFEAHVSRTSCNR